VATALVLGACTRSVAGSAANVSPQDIYAASVPADTMQTLLGGSTWWQAPPSFQVRPLQIESLPQTIRFAVTNRYVNVGTSDTFENLVQLWDSSTDATAHMTGVQNLLGTPINGPRVGDQQLYYQEPPAAGSPSYTTYAFVRLGPAVDTLTWTSGSNFASVNTVGKIASAAIGKLRSALGGRLRASPPAADDLSLLPPANQDITLLGMTHLPIETFGLMISVAAPEDLAKTFHDLGVSDFVFGDYALDNDTQMEVRAGVITFSSDQDAKDLLNSFRTSSDTSNPFVVLYQDQSGPGQYYVMFAAKTQFAILICRNTALTVAASRSCENPISRVGDAWYSTLSA
jgi:hypothetical protein